MSTEVEAVTELCPHAEGVWWVYTQGGTIHVWNLDARTVTRAPGGESLAGTMRWDGEPRPLLVVFSWPKVGSSALFVLQHPSDPNRVTYRTCSTITAITRAPR